MIVHCVFIVTQRIVFFGRHGDSAILFHTIKYHHSPSQFLPNDRPLPSIHPVPSPILTLHSDKSQFTALKLHSPPSFTPFHKYPKAMFASRTTMRTLSYLKGARITPTWHRFAVSSSSLFFRSFSSEPTGKETEKQQLVPPRQFTTILIIVGVTTKRT